MTQTPAPTITDCSIRTAPATIRKNSRPKSTHRDAGTDWSNNLLAGVLTTDNNRHPLNKNGYGRA